MEVFVSTEVHDGVGQISLNRPDKRNALTREFIEQLRAAVTQVANDASVRVLVFRAEGSVFCAGMDLGEMQRRAESETGKQEWKKDSEVYAQLLMSVFELPIPTIAVLQGPVLAGGVGLVLACDFVVGSEAAFVMLPEPARGITAAIVAPFLIYRVGPGPASQLLLSGERMSAARALALGLAFDVAKPEKLQERVESLVRSIMTGSQSALAITKRHLQYCCAGEIEEQVRTSIDV